MKALRTLVVWAILFVSAAATFAAPVTLPKLGASANDVTVSGLSSGAFMAVQYQVAYSGSVIGAGIVAGGPYYCMENVYLVNYDLCMGMLRIQPTGGHLVDDARRFETDNKIDPLSNLRNSRIYVFSGTQDTVVRTPAVDGTVDFFKAAGVPPSNIM